MDRITFAILVAVNLILGGSVYYFHNINTTPEADILGVDLNNNGVRDDVEEYIKNNFTDSWEIGALMQYAKKTQIQLINRNNSEEVSRLAHDEKDRNCGLFVFEKTRGNPLEFHDVTKKLDKIIYNTKPRIKAYDTFNRNVAGGMYRGAEPSIDNCEFYQNEVSKWQTYKNEKYRFEIKYPLGVLKPVQIEDKGNTISFNYFGELNNAYTTSFKIGIEKNKLRADMLDWYKINVDPDMIIYKQGGVDASWTTPDVYQFNDKPIPKAYTNKYGQVKAKAYVMSTNNAYVLSFSKGDSTDLDTKKLNLLISTIKFK